MQVFLDDQLLRFEPPAGGRAPQGTIADAFATARQQAENAGRVVIDVQLNGRPMPEEHLGNPPLTPLSSSEGELRFITADPLALVRQTLLDVGYALDDAKMDQDQAAEMIQSGNVGEALGKLGESLKTWDQVRQAVVNGVALLGLNADTLSVEVKPEGGKGGTLVLAEQVRLLADRLSELKRTITAQDWAGLSDALEYDMGEQAKSWKLLLVGLSSTIESTRPLGPLPASGKLG